MQRSAQRSRIRPLWPSLLALLAVACAARPAAEAPAPTTPPPIATTPAPAAAPLPPAPRKPVFAARPTMTTAEARFASGGVQPGQTLPALTVLDLAGVPVDVAQLRGDRPLVLVTCSLTCNVARRQQAKFAELEQQWRGRATFVLVYTIDAHPSGDPCPYTGDDWVPQQNELDQVLVRQPTSIDARLELARQYAAKWAPGITVLVDTMDDASWHALGDAPNVGLCVDRGGVVIARSGWFDPAVIDAALQKLVR